MSVRRRAQLVDEMNQKQAEIDKLDVKLKELDAMTPPERIMHGLHDMLCKQNHTDGCGFHYEAQVDTRKRWMAKAVAVHEYIQEHGISEEEMFELLYLTDKP